MVVKRRPSSLTWLIPLPPNRLSTKENTRLPSKTIREYLSRYNNSETSTSLCTFTVCVNNWERIPYTCNEDTATKLINYMK